MKQGIDVSKHQGTIDWSRVRQDGVEFAMLRAGYGRFAHQKDPEFETNYAQAVANGIPVGAYHYSYAKSRADAVEEAKLFLRWLDGKQFAYPVAYDIEEADQAKLGRAAVSDMIRAFCETVEAAGYYVCVYANKYFLDNFIDEDCKKKYDIWVAQWAKENTYDGDYGMWQYTSSGEKDGIRGKVDLDYAYKNYPQIMAENGLNGFQKIAPKPPQQPNFPAGMMVTLHNTPLFVSATAKEPAVRKSGTYYIYDGKELSGRYRLTNSPARVGKTPVGDNVTGFANRTDLR